MVLQMRQQLRQLQQLQQQMQMQKLMLLLFPMQLLISAPLHAQSFETCSPENSYVESLLPIAKPYPRPSAVPQFCVQQAHLSLPVKGYYGFCETSVGTPTRSHPRPCVSEKYVSAVHRALLDATDCFGHDALLAFATFNLESALHLNAVGAATDVGVGQLTKSAIDEVNMNALDRARRQAQASTKASCRAMLPFMTAHPGDAPNRCGFMSLPENPNRNVIYSVLLMLQNKRIIENLWNRHGIVLPAEVDSVRLKSLLAMLAYNSGGGGLMATLKAYVQQMGAENLTNSHFRMEGLDEAGFTRYLEANFPTNDAATRKRVSKYIGHVMTSARRVDKLAGGTQACLHTEYFERPIQPLEPSPQPDRKLARKLVKENLLAMAREEEKEVTDCETARHNFMFKFAPRGAALKDLPDYLRQAYDVLCD